MNCFSNEIKYNLQSVIKHTDDKFEDYCPGVGKTIDCSISGDFIYLTDAFYGVSSQTPAVCVYK